MPSLFFFCVVMKGVTTESLLNRILSRHYSMTFLPRSCGEIMTPCRVAIAFALGQEGINANRRVGKKLGEQRK